MNKADRKFMIRGHLPPPVTGENLCLARLSDVLQDFGCPVINVSTGIWPDLPKGYNVLVVVNGQSVIRTILDVIASAKALASGRLVYWYFHNASWRRYLMIPRWMWLGGQARIHAIVLRPSIAESFVDRRYRASVLPNRIEDVFESKMCPAADAENRRLIWLGRPDEAKGFPTALAVFAAVRRHDDAWRFDVYGADTEFAASRGWIQEGVFYHGFVSGVDKVKAFSRGGVFILPSRYRNETQPLSIIEAMSAGVPIVASSMGGIPEMLTAGGLCAGFSLRTMNVEDYVRAINEVVCNYQPFSRDALEIYKRFFSAGVFKENVGKLFLKSP